jgi:protein SCO1
MIQAIRRGAMPHVIWGVFILLAVFVASCGGTQSAGNATNKAPSSGLQGTDLGASPAPGFHLIDQNHQAISLAQFRGMPVIVTFFYTHCTTSCPLIANKIHTALVQLGPAAQHVAILAISVDPSGDTPANAITFSQVHQLQGYHYWHYLLGTRQELTPIWAAYDVAGIPPGAAVMSQSAMQHSAVVYIIDQRGRERVLLDSDFSSTQLVEDIHLLQTSRS